MPQCPPDWWRQCRRICGGWSKNLLLYVTANGYAVLAKRKKMCSVCFTNVADISPLKRRSRPQPHYRANEYSLRAMRVALAAPGGLLQRLCLPDKPFNYMQSLALYRVSDSGARIVSCADLFHRFQVAFCDLRGGTHGVLCIKNL